MYNQWLVKSLDPVTGSVIGQHWDDITEYPILGETEIWQFENPGSMMHPVHVHLVMFQILDKAELNTGDPIPLQPWEIGTWKDTVQVPPNSKVRVIMTFEDYVGKFAYHCHLLDHEDHEMMRQFQTTHDPASCDSENCSTCPADCAGSQGGANPWCCGYDDGAVSNSIGCGDALCEGAETSATCGTDCTDSDIDGMPDVVDSDDDNDGAPDGIDEFPLDPSESVDTDSDGQGDNADPDDDGDGIADGLDPDPLTPSNDASCKGGVDDLPLSTVLFVQPVATVVTCAATQRITLQPPVKIQSGGSLTLIAPQVVFDPQVSSIFAEPGGTLKIISADPSP